MRAGLASSRSTLTPGGSFSVAAPTALAGTRIASGATRNRLRIMVRQASEGSKKSLATDEHRSTQMAEHGEEFPFDSFLICVHLCSSVASDSFLHGGAADQRHGDELLDHLAGVGVAEADLAVETSARDLLAVGPEDDAENPADLVELRDQLAGSGLVDPDLAGTVEARACGEAG